MIVYLENMLLYFHLFLCSKMGMVVYLFLWPLALNPKTIMNKLRNTNYISFYY